MTSRPAPFRQSDVCRAVKGAKAAGVEVKRVEIDPSGKIIIVSAHGTSARDKCNHDHDNEWDDVLR